MPGRIRATETKCLAIDLGASSGRVVVGELAQDCLRLEEIGRFATPTRTAADSGYQCWDIDAIASEIERNLAQARLSKGVTSVGVDSWAVDYVLLDEDLNRVGVPVCYRDKRTTGVMEDVCGRLSRGEIYGRTGIQFLTFNSIYQLAACHAQTPEWLESAAHFLMIPDYLHFRLSGVLSNEYTNATTTQLCGLDGEWDRFLTRSIGLKDSLMKTPVAAGTVLGEGTGEARGLKVVAPATHDTGSAIAGTPIAGPDEAYISSGTWSLMGIESMVPIANEPAMRMNFTNEGGMERRFRVLKNIMGMWPIQRLCEEQKVRDFGPVVERAAQEQPWRAIINVNDPEFLNPRSMTNSIREQCRRSGQPVPETMAQLARCVFDSLALSYRMVKEQLELLQGQKLRRIRIVGGGSRNVLLNQLCADACELPVTAGPVEASVLGNLCVQMIALGAIENLSAARELIGRSFEMQAYQPQRSVPADVVLRFEEMMAMDEARGQACA
ncbi:rhamnulokinase [Occallatibacter savannae]|uniref:rhamnulokinase n=1 Tax=Occallatibacter savannae TaxID=1002691 RepID=UPI000D695926|nr:rhamnulokinase [Occallatibacter savannae]